MLREARQCRPPGLSRKPPGQDGCGSVGVKTRLDKHWTARDIVMQGPREAMLGKGDRAMLRRGLDWAGLCWGGENMV